MNFHYVHSSGLIRNILWRNIKRKGKNRMGLQILGWSMLIIGLILIVWGFIEFPENEWLKGDFLSLALSGVVLITGALAILKISPWLIIVAIIIATVLLAIYIWNFHMGIANTLISYVVVLAVVSWLISLVLK